MEGWEDEMKNPTDGMTEEQVRQMNTASLDLMGRHGELSTLLLSSPEFEVEELVNMPDPGNGFYRVALKPSLLRVPEDGKWLEYIHDRFKIVMISQSDTMSSGILVADPEVFFLITGKENPDYIGKDRIIIGLDEPDLIQAFGEYSVAPMKRLDAQFYLKELDPAFEYFSLEEAAYEIRVGYKPPKKGDIGMPIRMLGPENIDEHGEVISAPQEIYPDKHVNIMPLKKGDLVIVAYGGNVKETNLGRVGWGSVIDERLAASENCYASHLFFRVKLKPGYDPYYILCALGQEYVRKQVLGLAKTSGGRQFILTKQQVSGIMFRRLDNMSEIGRKYREALEGVRKAYSILKKLRR